MYSNSCPSCSFEREIIKIGQSSHKMYNNKILNVQGSTTILNDHTKKFWELIVCTLYQVFLSNTNNLHIVVWYQVFLSNSNNSRIIINKTLTGFEYSYQYVSLNIWCILRLFTDVRCLVFLCWLLLVPQDFSYCTLWPWSRVCSCYSPSGNFEPNVFFFDSHVLIVLISLFIIRNDFAFLKRF